MEDLNSRVQPGYLYFWCFFFFVLSLVEFVELVVYTLGKVGICIYFVRQFSVSKIFCFHPCFGQDYRIYWLTNSMNNSYLPVGHVLLDSFFHQGRHHSWKTSHVQLMEISQIKPSCTLHIAMFSSFVAGWWRHSCLKVSLSSINSFTWPTYVYYQLLD